MDQRVLLANFEMKFSFFDEGSTCEMRSTRRIVISHSNLCVYTQLNELRFNARHLNLGSSCIRDLFLVYSESPSKFVQIHRNLCGITNYTFLVRIKSS